MATLRVNNCGDPIGTANPITLSSAGALTATWPSAPANMPTVASPNILKISVEPSTPNEEIIYVTAYTSGATSATVTRAAEGPGTARTHAGTAWVHCPTAADFILAGDITGDIAAANVAKFQGTALQTASPPAAWDALCYWTGGPAWVNFPVVQDIQNIPANGITVTSTKAGSGTGGTPIAGDVTLKVTLPYAYNGLNGNLNCSAATNYSVCGSSLAAGLWVIMAQALFVPSAVGAFTFWIGTTQASSAGVMIPYEISVVSAQVGSAFMASFFAITNQGAAFVAWLNHYGPGCQIRSATSNYAFAGATGLTSFKIG
jgi:hypothetical protein